MLNINNEKSIKIAIWFVAFIFPAVILFRGILITFINTGSLALYWIVVPFIISLGVLLKVKLARWIMIFWFYILFFNEFIGTNTGMTVCFSSNIWTLLDVWSLSNFIDLFF